MQVVYPIARVYHKSFVNVCKADETGQVRTLFGVGLQKEPIVVYSSRKLIVLHGIDFLLRNIRILSQAKRGFGLNIRDLFLLSCHILSLNEYKHVKTEYIYRTERNEATIIFCSEGNGKGSP